MNKLKIGYLQQHNVADATDNMNRLAEGIKQLAGQGAQLIVLQELHNSLYFCQVEDVDNFDLAEPIPGPSTDFFGAIAKECGVVIVTSLFERRAPGLYHNTAVVIERDGAIGYAASDTPDEQQRQREAWTTVQRGHAVANGLPVVSVNRVGFEPDPSRQTPGIEFWGSSMVVGPQGEMLHRSPSDEEESITVEIDLAHSEDVRRWWPFLRDRRIDEYKGITKRFID